MGSVCVSSCRGCVFVVHPVAILSAVYAFLRIFTCYNRNITSFVDIWISISSGVIQSWSE